MLRDHELDLPLAPMVCFDTVRFARPWAQAFGDRLISCFLSSNWSFREIALRKLGLSFQELLALDATLWPTALAILERACSDAVLKVYETALQIISALRLPADHALLVPVFERVLVKCGDINRPTRERSLCAIVELLRRGSISFETVLHCLCAPLKEPLLAEGEGPLQQWRWLLGRLNVIARLSEASVLSEFCTDAASIKKIKAWAQGFREHEHLNVRKQTRTVLGLLEDVDATSLPTEADKGDTRTTAASAAACEACDDAAAASVTIDDLYLENISWLKGPLLGAGAFSSVYLARDIKTGHKMAVKQLSLAGTTRNSEKRVRVCVDRELALLHCLPQHPYIVNYRGCVTEGSFAYFFMELVEGGSLSALVESQGPLKVHVVQRFSRQILTGLCHLHDLGIIHRDVKGANVLVDAKHLSVKLCDYGAAGLLNSGHTSQGGLVSSHGTPAYMAPEVIRGEAYGRRADVWSFGCTVIEMASGLPPWAEVEDCNAFTLMYKIASTDETPLLPADIGQSGQALIRACLTRDYNTRPSSSALLGHAFLAETPIE